MGDTTTSKSSPTEQPFVDSVAKPQLPELSPKMYEYKQELLQGAELNARYEESNKMYICHLCDFRTAFRNSLLNHQAVHSDFRPWVCAMCDYAAKRKQDLKKHLHTIHGMMVESTMLKPVDSYTTNTNPNPRALSRGEGSEDNSWDGGKVNQMLDLTSTILSSRLPDTPSDGPVNDTFPTPNKHIPSSGTEPINIKQEKLENTSPHCASTHGTLPSMSNFVHLNSRDSPDYDLPISFPPVTCPETLLIPQYHGVSPKFQRNSPRHHDEDHKSAPDYSKINRTFVAHDNLISSPDIPISSTSFTQCRRRSHTTSVDDPVSKESTTMSGQWSSPPPSKFRKSFDSDDLPCSSSVSVSHSRSSQTRDTFLCEHCDIMFFQRAMYLMHAGLHSTSNPWCCTVCGSTFTEKYSFTSHFINQH